MCLAPSEVFLLPTDIGHVGPGLVFVGRDAHVSGLVAPRQSSASPSTSGPRGSKSDDTSSGERQQWGLFFFPGALEDV